MIANVLVGLVAALHLCFLGLEMFLWDTPHGRKVFGNSREFATASKVLMTAADTDDDKKLSKSEAQTLKSRVEAAVQTLGSGRSASGSPSARQRRIRSATPLGERARGQSAAKQ